MTLTAVSLFAGIGGFDVALERNGVDVKAAVEIDPHARRVLARHFPDTVLFDDVTKVTGDELRATGFVADRGIVTAGFPCQDVSVAGRRAGLAGERTGLWWHAVRLLAELNPRWFLGENVPGLLSSNGGQDFGAVLGSLGELGYGFAYRVLDAQHFGVPQQRRRVFIVGYLGEPFGAAAQVLLEPESGDGDSAARIPAGQGVTASTLSGPQNASGGGVMPALVSRYGKGTDSDASDALILDTHTHTHTTTSTLQGGGKRGYRIDAPGRRKEDDVNLVVSLAVAGDFSTSEGVAQTVRGAHGQPGCVAYQEIKEGLDDGDAAQGGPDQALRTLRDADGPQASTQRRSGVDAAFRSTEVLRPQVHGGGVRRETNDGHAELDDGALPRPEASTARAVREVQNTEGDGRASHQRRLAGQQAGEPNSPLPVLSSEDSPLQVTVRRLTELEAERLQGFPDEWTANQSGAARYRQLGNAVAVPVVEWIVNRLVAVDGMTHE